MVTDRRKPEPMSPVDTAWLRMDQPTNLTVINIVMMFDEPLDYERLKATIEHRLLRFDRFRQRVIYPERLATVPHWDYDPHFDVHSHLHRIALPDPGDQTALQDLVSDFISIPLDMSKPLWQFHLIENYGEGCALLVRLHHCIADGIALVRMVLSMADTTPDAPWPGTEPVEDVPLRRTPGILAQVFQPVSSFVRTTRWATRVAAQEGLGMLSNPFRVVDWMEMGASGASAISKLLLLPADPPSVLKGELGVVKRVAWSEPIPLESIKAIRRVTRSTVNDVLLAAVSGALRNYMIQQGDLARLFDIRAFVPVNLRPLDAPLELGNRFGLVFLSLPVSIDDMLERLLELKDRMDAIKNSSEAIVSFGILNAIGLMTNDLEQNLINVFGNKASLVMTNVPGPQQELYFAGSLARGAMFWVPHPGLLGMGVSILSYNGEVRIGVATDANLVPEPSVIIDLFRKELDFFGELVERAKTLGDNAPYEA